MLVFCLIASWTAHPSVLLAQGQSNKATAGRSAQGGALVMQAAASSVERSVEVQIGLPIYSGQALKVMQFRIISYGTMRITRVQQGSSLSPANAWNLHHHIRKGSPDAAGIVRDTVNVVVLAAGFTTLAPGAYPGIAQLTVECPDGVSPADAVARLEMSDVLGALPKGENAGIQGATPISVRLTQN